MYDRVHACLDGDLSPEALTPQERARLAELEPALARAAAQLRAESAPDLARRVMDALPAGAPRRTPVDALRSALGWLWNPRPVRLTLRPAYGLMAAGVAAVALAQLPVPDADDSGRIAGPPAVAAPAQSAVYVQFRLDARGADEVALAGTFTGWKPTYHLRETEPGVWTALVPLRPGVHDYAFVVDGRTWVPDPHAPQVDDSFGGTNSRISLPPVQPQT